MCDNALRKKLPEEMPGGDVSKPGFKLAHQSVPSFRTRLSTDASLNRRKATSVLESAFGQPPH